MKVSDVPNQVLCDDLSRLHNVEVLSKIQHLLMEMLTSFKGGIPICNKPEDQARYADILLLANLMFMELSKRMSMDAVPGYSADTINTTAGVEDREIVLAVVVEKFREDTGKREWALMSKEADKKTGRRKVLYWFGKDKPSDEAVKKQEQRVQYFKHAKGAKERDLEKIYEFAQVDNGLFDQACKRFPEYNDIGNSDHEDAVLFVLDGLDDKYDLKPDERDKLNEMISAGLS